MCSTAVKGTTQSWVDLATISSPVALAETECKGGADATHSMLDAAPATPSLLTFLMVETASSSAQEEETSGSQQVAMMLASINAEISLPSLIMPLVIYSAVGSISSN